MLALGGLLDGQLLGMARYAAAAAACVQVRLEGPFEDYTARDVAAFLRLLYNPAAAAVELPEDAAFSALESRLPALLRLAHQLQVEALQASIVEHVSRAAQWRSWFPGCPCWSSCGWQGPGQRAC